MSTLGGGSQPVLVYNRIANNRRNTWFLVAASVLALLPFVACLSYAFSAVVVRQVRTQSRSQRAMVRSYERTLKRADATEHVRSEWDQWIEIDLRRQKAKLAELEAGDLDLTLTLMPVFAGALLASMGILFWGIASSPTSKL